MTAIIPPILRPIHIIIALYLLWFVRLVAHPSLLVSILSVSLLRIPQVYVQGCYARLWHDSILIGFQVHGFALIGGVL